MCFRRPLLAVLQKVFPEIQGLVNNGIESKVPDLNMVDEVIMVMNLVPLMFTNLRATLSNEVSVTDASPTGGGTAVATEFRPEALTLKDKEEGKCYEYGRELEPQEHYPGPAQCGGTFCSLEYMWADRDIDRASKRPSPFRRMLQWTASSAKPCSSSPRTHRGTGAL